MASRNLIIIHRGEDYRRDFDEIAGRVASLDPDIAVFCGTPRSRRVMPDERWEHPTLTVALLQSFMTEIRRGPILKNRQIHKPGQYRIFADAGLPFPPALPFRPGMKLDPIMFGEFVVIKPSDPNFGSHGRGVHLFRRRKLEGMSLQDFPRGHDLHKDPGGFLVQRFIDIGRHIPLYRVLSLFGAPLYCWFAREKLPQPPIEGSDEVIEKLRITNNGNFRERFLCSEQDVLDLSVRVGNAFPDIPILGMDIMREERTGKLYVLECNPGGNTWHFSARETAGIRRELGGASMVGQKKGELLGRQKMVDQFGAFDRAAEVLVKKVRELAA